MTTGELVQHPAAALAQPELHSAGPRERRGNAILFALLIAVVCGWVLSLPVFPSQDGPAHKFYAGVLALELAGDPYAHAYTIREPIPPPGQEPSGIVLPLQLLYRCVSPSPFDLSSSNQA